MLVRESLAADAPAMSALYNWARQQQYVSHHVGKTEERSAAYLAKQMTRPDNQFLLVEDKGRLMGFLWGVLRPVSEVSHIRVVMWPIETRHGAPKAAQANRHLMNVWAKRMMQEGYKYTWAEFDVGQRPALALFRDLTGFETVPEGSDTVRLGGSLADLAAHTERWANV